MIIIRSKRTIYRIGFAQLERRLNYLNYLWAKEFRRFSTICRRINLTNKKQNMLNFIEHAKRIDRM